MLVVEELQRTSRKAIITSWYEEVFPMVASYIHKKGGDLEVAKEIFQEAIVIYYEKLTVSGFKPEGEDRAYLMGIAKKIWLKHCSRLQSHAIPDELELMEEESPKPITHKLLSFLKQSGEKCMNVLQAFYYEKLTMKQVADRFGYTSERSATVQKYKCLEKVRDEIKQKSLTYEDFLN